MATVYYKNRQEAGEKAVAAFAHLAGEPLTVVSLNTDALTIGAYLANGLRCPLQLYLAASIDVPGGLRIGSVSQGGGFSYAGGLSNIEAEYYHQEFRGYIEDAKRAAFSGINRELGQQTVIRKDLLRGRSIIVVDDCLTDTTTLDSFIEFLKPVNYRKLYVCAPIIASPLISRIRQISDYCYFSGTVDHFYGKDHYFEDNTVWDRSSGIRLVSDFLKLWPVQA